MFFSRIQRMNLRILLCVVYIEVVRGEGVYLSSRGKNGFVFNFLLLFVSSEGIPFNGLHSTKP
jgi:hypothetical protein